MIVAENRYFRAMNTNTNNSFQKPGMIEDFWFQHLVSTSSATWGFNLLNDFMYIMSYFENDGFEGWQILQILQIPEIPEEWQGSRLWEVGSPHQSGSWTKYIIQVC